MEETGRIPKSLSAFHGSFPMERRRVKLSLLNGTTANSNGNIRIRLPDRALIDMSTFIVQGKATTTGDTGAGNGSGVPPAYAMIKSIQFTLGGVNIGANNQYFNQTAHALNLAAQSTDWDKSNVMGLSYNTAQQVPTATNNQANVDFRWNWWPYTLAAAGVLDTAVFSGGLECDIRLESSACVNTIGTPSADFSLAQLVSYVDILLPASEGYSKTMASRLASGGVVKKYIPAAVSFNQVQNGSNSFNVASQSLDAVMVGVKPNGWNTQAAKGANAYNNFLSFSLNDTAANQVMYLQLANGQNVPSYGQPENSFEHSDMTRNWAGKTSPYNYNKLFYNSTAAQNDTRLNNYYLSRNFVWYAQVGGEDSACDNHGLATGLDTTGGSSIIRVNSVNLEADDELIMAGLCSSTIEAKAGGLIAFIQ